MWWWVGWWVGGRAGDRAAACHFNAVRLQMESQTPAQTGPLLHASLFQINRRWQRAALGGQDRALHAELAAGGAGDQCRLVPLPAATTGGRYGSLVDCVCVLPQPLVLLYIEVLLQLCVPASCYPVLRRSS